MLDVVPESLVGSMRGACADMSPASRRERESVVHEALDLRPLGSSHRAVLRGQVKRGDLVEARRVGSRRYASVVRTVHSEGECEIQLIDHRVAIDLLTLYLAGQISAEQLRVEALALPASDASFSAFPGVGSEAVLLTRMIEASKREAAVSIAEAARVFPEIDTSTANGDALRRRAQLMGVPTYKNGQCEIDDVAAMTTRAIEAARADQRVRITTADGRVHEGKINWDPNPNTSLPIFMLDQADAGWMGLVSGVRTDLRVVSLDVLSTYANSIEPGQRVSSQARGEKLGHEADVLRRDGDRWMSSVTSSRELGPGDLLEVVTRGADPYRLAAVIDHVVTSNLRAHVWTWTVVHRLVHTGDVSELLRQYPDAATNTYVRLELRAKAFKLETATFRDAKLGAPLVAGNSSTRKSDEWIEVTTLEQAKALDGKLVEIDAKDVDAAWDTAALHGQTKQCAWDSRTLRAGAHGPVLWGYSRLRGLRLRVVEESSSVSEAQSAMTAMTAMRLPGGFTLRLPGPTSTVSVVGGTAAEALGIWAAKQRDGRSFRGGQAHGCERCCFTGVLVGFTSPDRPCGCVRMKSEGPKEWEVVERIELLTEGVDLSVDAGDGGWSATYEAVVVQKSEQRSTYMVADFSEGPGRASGTAAVCLHDDKLDMPELTTEAVARWWQEGKPIHTLAVHGERCRDMIVDRLVCALRDGSVKP
jgi:hypothetical protein